MPGWDDTFQIEEHLFWACDESSSNIFPISCYPVRSDSGKKLYNTIIVLFLSTSEILDVFWPVAHFIVKKKINSQREYISIARIGRSWNKNIRYGDSSFPVDNKSAEMAHLSEDNSSREVQCDTFASVFFSW